MDFGIGKNLAGRGEQWSRENQASDAEKLDQKNFAGRFRIFAFGGGNKSGW